MSDPRPPYRRVMPPFTPAEVEQPPPPPVGFGEVPTGIGLGVFHGWPKENQPGPIIHQQSNIRTWRIQGGPRLKNWDAGEAFEHIQMLMRTFPDVRFVIGLHDGADELDQTERWRNYVTRLIQMLGAQDYILDAETMNPRFSPGGSWEAFADIIEPVVKAIHAVGGRAWGPGNTGHKELPHLDALLGSMTLRGARFDVATAHAYPETHGGVRAWAQNFENNWWSGTSHLLREQEKIMRAHGYDYGVLGETGTTGRAWGFFQQMYDAIATQGPDQRVFDSRQKRRMRTLLERINAGNSFWRLALLYQITEGPDIGSPDGDWGMTTPRGMPKGQFQAKPVLSLFPPTVVQ